MKSAIIVHPDFDMKWPFAADYLADIWKKQSSVDFVRLDYREQGTKRSRKDISVPGDYMSRPARLTHEYFQNPEELSRLACLGVDFREDSIKHMPALREIACQVSDASPLLSSFEKAGIRPIWHKTEGYWGQSVSEFGFALTLCGLRRIPQTHHRIMTALDDWRYYQADGIGKPGERGQQFGDDPDFSCGCLEGKRVRIVGAGNIGSRYASFCNFFGADVSVWDPFASEPCFHRAGSRREYFLEQLVRDAEIFAPMVPLNDQTRGLIKREHIEALPKGCLVVMVTRAKICDCDTLYRRVLHKELALAADVFDHEPLEIGNALLGRDNVVHTPHNAGRTKEANHAFAKMLADQFTPFNSNQE